MAVNISVEQGHIPGRLIVCLKDGTKILWQRSGGISQQEHLLDLADKQRKKGMKPKS